MQLISGNAASEGIIRNAKGDWIARYNRFIRKCSIFNSELWAIFDGLQLTQQRGHDNVIIQSDSLEVIKAIHGSDSSTSNSSLIRIIRNILEQEKQWNLIYIPREQNQVADCLAKQALARKEELQILELPPTLALDLLEVDKINNASFFQFT